MMQWVGVLLVVSLLCGGFCQSEEECAMVGIGLAPVLAPCRQSVPACVAIGLDQFTPAFCSESGRGPFDNFLACERRPFTDQIFGAICGGPSCAGADKSFSECGSLDGMRCYDNDVVSQNNGTNAFEACLCSTEGRNASCPMDCANQLQQLVDDVGCCVNTALYSLFFSTCNGGSDDGTDFQGVVDALKSLFDMCDVDLPASCLHPFSISNRSKSKITEAGLLISCFMFLVTCIL
jgi:hypothetical protein